VFGQFAGENQPYGSLNFARADGGSFVVEGDFGGLGSKTFKDVVAKRLANSHCFVGHADVGMDLFQDYAISICSPDWVKIKEEESVKGETLFHECLEIDTNFESTQVKDGQKADAHQSRGKGCSSI
jgi:hypothetical protein